MHWRRSQYQVVPSGSTQSDFRLTAKSELAQKSGTMNGPCPATRARFCRIAIRHMADVAEQFLKGKEQAFLVVGAAHLVGKEGVVTILVKRGYKVEQVPLKN